MEYVGLSSEEALYHHGIKGQKWGVRRTPEQLGYKVERLQQKNVRLSSVDTAKYRLKGDKFMAKAAKKGAKANGKLPRLAKGTIWGNKHNQRIADKMYYKAKSQYAKADKIKDKIAKNENKIAKLNTKISDIKKLDIERGEMMIAKWGLKEGKLADREKKKLDRSTPGSKKYEKHASQYNRNAMNLLMTAQGLKNANDRGAHFTVTKNKK